MSSVRRPLALAALVLVFVCLASPALAQGGDGPAPQAGAQIVLSGSVVVPRGKEAGEIVVFHGSASIGGVALGDVVVLDGPIRVNGQVSGSVIAVTGDVSLGRGAQVGGDVMAGGSVDADPAAEVSGGVTEGVAFTLRGPLEAVGRVLVWLAIGVSALLLGVFLLVVAPRGVDAVHSAATTAPWPSAGWGLAVFVGVPIVAVLLVASVIGLPLGLTLLLALAFVLSLGFTLSAWVVGRLVWPPPRSPWPALLFGWLMATAAIGVPGLGVVVWFLGAAFGLGAATVATWRARGRRGTHRPGVARPVVRETPSVTEGPEPIQEEVGL